MMLAGIAHEVRNPLGGLELYAGLLRDALGGQPERLEEVRADRARGRPPEDGGERVPGVRPPAAAEPGGGGAGTALRRGARADRARRAARRSPSTCRPALRVRADAGQLRRALLNLARNAAAAARNGARWQLAARAAPRRRGVRIEVRDDGPGVPAALREQIFTPFFTTREKGTGLGLAFVREIVRDHGGDVVVRDAPGGGSVLQLRPSGGASRASRRQRDATHGDARPHRSEVPRSRSGRRPPRVAGAARRDHGRARRGRRSTGVRIETPRAATDAEIEAVHSAGYRARLGAPRRASTPSSIPTPSSRPAAGRRRSLAAGAAVGAVEAVMDGRAANAFALVRPPGHHAAPGAGDGLLPASTTPPIAAEAARRAGAERVLILDWDVHHGNGTQDDLRGARRRPLHVGRTSIPFYPGTGAADEIGVGAGAGRHGQLPAAGRPGRRRLRRRVSRSVSAGRARLRARPRSSSRPASTRTRAIRWPRCASPSAGSRP